MPENREPERAARRRFPVIAAIALGIVVIAGLALWLAVLPGPRTEIDDHLDDLAQIVDRTRPAGASAVGSYRNDECDSGVEGVGTTFRTTRSLGSIQRGYRHTLNRTGWKVAELNLEQRDGFGSLSATKRFSWGATEFVVSPSDRHDEIDVSAEFNC